MHRVSRFDLAPLDYGGESLGRRLARLRRERCLSQGQVALRIGIHQGLVSDYERGRLRLSADTAVRFTIALRVSLYELLLPCVEPQGLSQPAAPTAVPRMQSEQRRTAGGRRAGYRGLTPREAMVLEYLECSCTNAEIAWETGLQVSTIKVHVSRILVKLGAYSRRELARDRLWSTRRRAAARPWRHNARPEV